MQPKLIHCFLLLFIVTAGKPVFAQQNDSTTIAQLLKADYATMGTLDIPTHLRNLTNDYYLIEHGEVWDIETELDSIYRKNANRVVTRTDFFTFKTIKAAGDMAYAIWHLKSEFRENGNLRVKVWNESGVFRKEQGQWKIALIHSSPASQDGNP
jgi:ketosteroid isomerase-like protein